MKRLHLIYGIAFALMVSGVSAESLFASGKTVDANTVWTSDENKNTVEIDSVILKGTVSKEEYLSLLAKPIEGPKLSSVLKKRIKYPVEASNNGIEGKVNVLFTVDQNGTVSDINVMESPHDELSNEVKRALEQMRFEPVIQNGMPLIYKLILPVRFELL